MIATTNHTNDDTDPANLLDRMLAWEPMPESTAYAVASAILDGRFTPITAAAVLTAMHMRGESIDELCGFVRAVRERAIPVETQEKNVIDTCGTGGSGLNTVNISTAAAIIAAAAGCRVAKHGNRSVSSRTGSSDVVQALGIPMDTLPETAAERLADAGITFLHAPYFHPGLRRIAGLRRELGIRTIFNLVGPLANPANIRRQLVGLSCGVLLRDVVDTLRVLGAEHVLAVHGEDGADEITLTGATSVCELRQGSIHEYQVTPEQFGLNQCTPSDLRGGDAVENAAAIREALADRESPVRDMILLNAGAAIYVGGLSGSIEEGIALARETVRSRIALNKLDELRATHETAGITRELNR